MRLHPFCCVTALAFASTAPAGNAKGITGRHPGSVPRTEIASPLRVLTWNLHLGAAGSDWAGLGRSLPLDVSFLQEAKRPAVPGTSLWRSVPGQTWGSAVAVREGALEDIQVPGYEGWVVGARWFRPPLSEACPTYLFSLHTPRGHGSYEKETLAILNVLRDLVPTGGEVLIGGDFNLKSFGERTAGEALATTRAERQVLDLVADMKLVSCWPAAHPGEPLAQTLRWTGDRTRPFHCDAILVPREWAHGVQCEIPSTPDIDSASDHSPVLAMVSPPVDCWG